MFGSRRYPEGEFAPQRGDRHDWHVWCMTGALTVLQGNGIAERLADPAEFTLNFANGSYAAITPEHPLWERLAEIAKTHTVEVYPLNWSGKYLSWTGAPDSLRHFDAISITPKTSP